MPQSYSNYLKVIFVPEDLCEMSEAILRSDCLTVQHFSYKSQRNHNTRTGLTLHDEDSTILDFTIRIDTPDCGKKLLEQIQSNEQFSYSFLFNATFKSSGRLLDYEDALVAYGSIIDIEEEFYTPTQPQNQELMLMHVKLLLLSVTFIGKNQNLIMKL